MEGRLRDVGHHLAVFIDHADVKGHKLRIELEGRGVVLNGRRRLRHGESRNKNRKK